MPEETIERSLTAPLDAAKPGAHNAVELPDQDPVRRGYLADHLFAEPVDYTRCEVPVVHKLVYGRTRTFAEIDEGAGPRSPIMRTDRSL